MEKCFKCGTAVGRFVYAEEGGVYCSKKCAGSKQAEKVLARDIGIKPKAVSKHPEAFSLLAAAARAMQPLRLTEDLEQLRKEVLNSNSYQEAREAIESYVDLEVQSEN